MNAYQCELNGKKFAQAYNYTGVRVQQGKTRAAKGNYRPAFARATQHIGMPQKS